MKKDSCTCNGAGRAQNGSGQIVRCDQHKAGEKLDYDPYANLKDTPHYIHNRNRNGL